jgi:rRNA maturation protein Nop10
MRTYICTSCGGSVVVGHPTEWFERQCAALARAAFPLAQRLRDGRAIRRRLMLAMVEKYYGGEHRYRYLPAACPRCGHGGSERRSWWTEGLSGR